MSNDSKRPRREGPKKAEPASASRSGKLGRDKPAPPPHPQTLAEPPDPWPPQEPSTSIDAIRPLDSAHRPVAYRTLENPIVLEPRWHRAIFEKVYAAEWGFVKRTVERYGVPARDADDVVQEAFTVAFRRIEDHDAARSARPWLFVIAMQLASNYRNLARHRVEPLSAAPPEEPSSDAIDVESALVAGEEQALARELIGRLSPKLREVLVKHDLEERPIAEIAAELGIPLKTAHARLRLAREEVRRRGRALVAASLRIYTRKPLRAPDLLLLRETILSYGYQPLPVARPAQAPLPPASASEPHIFFLTG